MKGLPQGPVSWVIDRLGLGPVVEKVRTHKVPPQLHGKRGWYYVFGAATLTALLVQLATGIGLATVYVPSAAQAHETLGVITATPFGGLVRALHYWGASAMVVLMLLHAARVYLTGSYKFPREGTWMVGTVLFLLVMTLALTGQLLRWDENGLYTVVVASKFIARVPLIGQPLGEFLLAGSDVGGATLSRFFALHVIVLPLLLLAGVGHHLWLVLHHGISEPPESGRPVDKRTYRAWYHDQKERLGIHYVPDSAWREAIVAVGVVSIIFALALVFGPKGPGPAPDPARFVAHPAPDWFVRWWYALLYLKPRSLESFVMIWGPLLFLGSMFALPLLAPTGERTMTRRPWAPVVVGVFAVSCVSLTWLGLRSPWTPPPDLPPISAARLGVAEGSAEAAGAKAFVHRGCAQCHQVLGEGGRWGPDLTALALRVSREEATVRIVMGLGDMPAYGGLLDKEELDALVAFLWRLPDVRGGDTGGASR